MNWEGTFALRKPWQCGLSVAHENLWCLFSVTWQTCGLPAPRWYCWTWRPSPLPTTMPVICLERFEAASTFWIKIAVSLWNLTDVSATLLLSCLSFQSDRTNPNQQILRLQDFVRFLKTLQCTTTHCTAINACIETASGVRNAHYHWLLLACKIFLPMAGAQKKYACSVQHPLKQLHAQMPSCHFSMTFSAYGHFFVAWLNRCVLRFMDLWANVVSHDSHTSSCPWCHRFVLARSTVINTQNIFIHTEGQAAGQEEQ